MYRHIPFALSSVLVLFLILYFIPINAYIFAKICDEDDRVVIHVQTMFGLIRYDTEIHFIDWLLNRNKGANLKGNIFKRMILSGFKNKYKRHGKNYDDIFSAFYYLQNKVKIQRLSWKTQFGAGDAAATGVIYGVFWALKGLVLSLVQNYFSCEVITIHIDPQFNKKIFKTSVDCIIRIKIGYIMISSIILAYVRFKKSILRGGEQDGSSNRSINENNYG